MSGAQGACESNGSLSPIDENLIFANFLRMHVELRKAPFWWFVESTRAGGESCVSGVLFQNTGSTFSARRPRGNKSYSVQAAGPRPQGIMS